MIIMKLDYEISKKCNGSTDETTYDNVGKILSEDIGKPTKIRYNKI